MKRKYGCLMRLCLPLFKNVQLKNLITDFQTQLNFILILIFIE